MSSIAIVQARMGSSRFYGKVLKEICGKTIIEHIVYRLKQVQKIDKVVLATSSTEKDNPIEELCKNKGIPFFRGSESDVLDRFYQAAKHFGAKNGDTIIRITGDCPLIDPKIVDEIIKMFIERDSDYGANVNPPTFPDGLDTEVMKFSTLEKSWKEAKLLSEREHVTLHIRNHPEIFSISNYVSDIDYSDLRWTLDESEDFEVIKAIYENLYTEDKVFLMDDILKLLERKKEITEINKKFMRNEGLIKSLMNDKEVE
ncbi:MAG: cytidylyltransferase domain-containing protein [Ignavibacteriales bacterium]